MDNILIKQSWHSSSHPLYVYFYLPELDLEEGQSDFKPLYSTHFRIFVNLYINFIIKCNFCTSTQTICILW